MSTPNYITAAQIIAHIGQALCENFTGLSGAALSTELEDAACKAESLIHGYTGKKYPVPIVSSSAQPLLRDWTLRLVAYDLHNRGKGGEVQEKVRAEYMDTIWQLKDVEKGIIVLPGTEAEAETVSFYAQSNDAVFDWGDDDVAGDTF